MKKIAIFASGSGSNAENIVNYFLSNENISIDLIITNKKDAYVIERAKKLNVNCLYFIKEDFYNSKVLDLLKERQIDFIILAGFLLLISKDIIAHFNNKILNIHPALLPKYGGKGMFGNNVHKTVLVNKEEKSGISIHLVNEKYDEGSIIFQADCDINADETIQSLAQKIHSLEHKYFPDIIKNYILNFSL